MAKYWDKLTEQEKQMILQEVRQRNIELWIEEIRWTNDMTERDL